MKLERQTNKPKLTSLSKLLKLKNLFHRDSVGKYLNPEIFSNYQGLILIFGDKIRGHFKKIWATFPNQNGLKLNSSVLC